MLLFVWIFRASYSGSQYVFLSFCVCVRNCLNFSFDFFPIDSYPGLWEVPLTQWQCDELSENFGTMVDECEDDGSEKGVYDIIMRNFNSHYEGNKQPFPIFGHSFWFEGGSYRKDGNIDLRMLHLFRS